MSSEAIQRTAPIERPRYDPGAFGLIFDRHFDAILGYVFRGTADWDLARDLTADAFLRVFRGVTPIPMDGGARFLVAVCIATNEIRMHFRPPRRATSSLDQLRQEDGRYLLKTCTVLTLVRSLQELFAWQPLVGRSIAHSWYDG